MKNVLTIILLLLSVFCYSQSTVTIRGDSIQMIKVGGNSELILLNSTRGVSGGFLKNLGNGRTGFAVPPGSTNTSIGSSGFKVGVDGTNNIKSINPLNGLSGDSLTAGEIRLRIGGSDLSQYTAIGLNGFPLNIVHNGVNAAAQSDSNSLMLANNTAALTSTDSLVSPLIVFSTQGRKLTAGGASQSVKFRMGVVGLQGSSVASGNFVIASRLNNGVYSNVFTITPASAITSGTYNGATIGLLAPNNLRIGNSSTLASSPTGNLNVAIGSVALQSNIIGNENTAIGYSSLSLNDSDYNTAVGAYALADNTKGYQNVAFGKNALLHNTTGSKNAAGGAGAMENNTTGSQNSFWGEDAGLNITTGNFNSGLGWLAGSANAAGIGNTSIGWSAGRGVTSGDQNTFVGLEAGYLHSQAASVTNSIGIGYGASTTASNQIIIGNSSHTDTRIWGIASGLVAKRVLYDPATARLYYADTTAGGGGGGSGTVTSVDLAYGITGSSDPITTTGTVIADTTILVNKAGAQVISGVKNFTGNPNFATGFTLAGAAASGKFPIGNGTNYVASTLLLPNSATAGYIPFATATNTWGEDAGLSYNGTTNTLMITGTGSSLTNGPKVNQLIVGDANAAMSQFIYTQSNMASTMACWFDGTNWISSSASGNFLMYNSAGKIQFQLGSGNAPGSSFSPTATWSYDLTNGDIYQQYGAYSLGFTSTGSAKFNVRSTTRQAQWEYDASNYTNLTVGATGGVIFDAFGSGAGFTYSDRLHITNGATINVGGTLNSQYTDVGNVGAGEDNLMTYTLPANTMTQDGDHIDWEMSFTFNSTNSKNLKVYFGATNISAIVGSTAAGAHIVIRGTIVRTSATTQKSDATMVSNNALVAYNTSISSALAETLSGTVVIKATGEGTTTDDITQKTMMIKFFPVN